LFSIINILLFIWDDRACVVWWILIVPYGSSKFSCSFDIYVLYPIHNAMRKEFC
jgi:hypothetical protein